MISQMSVFTMMNYFIYLRTFKLLNYLMKVSLEHTLLPLFVLRTSEILYQLLPRVVLINILKVFK